MSGLAEQVAQVALDCFAGLPSKCKPRTFPEGRREWTPLAAVVVTRSCGQQPIIECVSLATGTKCLPSASIPKCGGAVLHDSHAEVLALRGFNRWLLQELLHQLDHQEYSSPYICCQQMADVGSESLPFRLADDVSVHFFTTEAPCGDASMELLIQSKPPEDAVPWDFGVETDPCGSGQNLAGRGNFALLGAVRRKPSRADAQASLSKSCTDKLTTKQLTSLLAFPADSFVELSHSAFIKTLIVPHDQYNEEGYQRAFGKNGRLKRQGQLHTTFFNVEKLPNDFPRFAYEKRCAPTGYSKASNISTIWVRGPGQCSGSTIEILLNGVKQGFRQFDDDARKQSVLCRQQMLTLGQALNQKVQATSLRDSSTYKQAKDNPWRQFAQQRKLEARHSLGRWPRNDGDDGWTL